MRRSSYELLLLGLSLALAGGMGLYSQRVMLPAERARYAAMGQPVDVGDLYPRWYGTRELLLHHRDPYGVEVSREIQVAYYGHALGPAGVDRGRDEQRFAYPVYVVLFLAPIVELPFARAQAVVRWTFAILAAASLLLWLQALRWRPSLTVTLALMALTLSSPPMVQALRLQQLAVLAAFFLAGCAALITRGQLFRAGCLLACATIKPQLVLLPALFFLIWAAGDWRRRRRLAWGFSAAMVLLIAAGQALLPGWLGKFFLGVIAYRHYVVMSSLFDLYLSPWIAQPAAVAVIVVVLAFCVVWRKGTAEHPEFLCRLALVLAVAVMALPLRPPFNQIVLLPGILAVLSQWNELWRRGGAVRAVCVAAATISLAPWFVAGALAAIHALSPEALPGRSWELPFILSFAAPPILAGLLILLLHHSAGQPKTPGAELA